MLSSHRRRCETLSGAIDIYGGLDPREVPAYSLKEVATYLGIPPSTLRSWIHGQAYKTQQGERFFVPLIRVAEEQQGMLSYANFVEAHVLRSLRNQVTLPAIRAILSDILGEKPESPHPLLEHEFATVGKEVFIEKAGNLINVSRQGQTGMRSVLEGYLRRIKRDPSGAVTDLYPLPGGKPIYLNWPNSVQMTPTVAFGRPVITGTSIPTGIISKRITAGETIAALAEDYDRSADEIFEAVRWELARAA